jgi:hypothetical protein
MARALGSALEPLLDVALAVGLTSPELESLLRVMFVQRAVAKLPPHPRSGKAPSDVLISLATGLHRSEVTRIRRAGAKDSVRSRIEKRERLYSKTGRILKAWNTDPRFRGSSGGPLDLPYDLNTQGPSFEELVSKYLPNSHAPTVLKELRRRALVRTTDDGIVRFRSLTSSGRGLTASNVAHASKRMQLLGATLIEKMQGVHKSLSYEETKKLRVDEEQLPLIRAVIEKRASHFISALELEFRASIRVRPKSKISRIGVSIFSWEDK